MRKFFTRTFWHEWIMYLAIYVPLAVLDIFLFWHGGTWFYVSLGFIIAASSWSSRRLQRKYWP